MRDPSIRFVNVTDQAHVHKNSAAPFVTTPQDHFQNMILHTACLHICYMLTPPDFGTFLFVEDGEMLLLIIESSINLGQKAQNSAGKRGRLMKSEKGVYHICHIYDTTFSLNFESAFLTNANNFKIFITDRSEYAWFQFCLLSNWSLFRTAETHKGSTLGKINSNCTFVRLKLRK